MLARIKSEVAYALGIRRVLAATRSVTAAPTKTLSDYLERWARDFGDRPALTSERESLTYRELDSRANRYARWARGQGLVKGDVVALMMPNRPEYLAVWLGLARAGIATALVNTNLSGASLVHSLDVVGAKRAIVEAALAPAFVAALADSPGPALHVHGASSVEAPRVDLEIAALSESALAPQDRPALTIDDAALYIYTSGTTGLPKAARITHSRALRLMLGISAAMSARSDDRMYLCLPMYHTNGGLLGPGSVLAVGGSCFIRERFSASEFWRDAAVHRSTLFVYIGELCRYLLNTPPGPSDRAHRIRLCVGNGLRPDIFASFQQRFDVAKVLEFYGATEGNAVLLNFDSRPGAVGRLPSWAASRFPAKLAAYDVSSEAHRRDARGFCIECGPDEVGELLGEIRDDPSLPAARFDGYADAKATQSKILRGVFKPGDAWFRTGDLLKRDALGYYYFVDRIGDTFRWKGENVSTTEVAEAISQFPGVEEATVYGVAVPNHDGRAGMAALVVTSLVEFDLAGLREHIAQSLPAYARPCFLRFRAHLDVTGTFKPKKMDLVAEGFDFRRIDEPLYFDDRIARAYRRADADLLAGLADGTIKL